MSTSLFLFLSIILYLMFVRLLIVIHVTRTRNNGWLSANFSYYLLNSKHTHTHARTHVLTHAAKHTCSNGDMRNGTSRPRAVNMTAR